MEKPLTEKEKKAISEFIKKDKERLAKRKTRKTASSKRQRQTKTGNTDPQK